MTRTWSALATVAPDPIHGIAARAAADERAFVLDLVIGGYRDESGRTPAMEPVETALRRITSGGAPMSYAPLLGSPETLRAMQAIIFGSDHGRLQKGLVASAHCPGGTGALRVGAELLARAGSRAAVWVSEPGWPGHEPLFRSVGLRTRTYPYVPMRDGSLDAGRVADALGESDPGDVVVLQGHGHNPTGIDPDGDGWRQLAEVLVARSLTPVVDLAYQGLALDEELDAYPIRRLADTMDTIVVAASNSKNFALYGLRVGSLHVATRRADITRLVESHLRSIVRSLYSNPPRLGGEVVAQIWGDPELRDQWSRELDRMRQRVHHLRTALAHGLEEVGLEGTTRLTTGKGLFACLPADASQMERLRRDFAVYGLDSGRINITGLQDITIPHFCEAVGAVLRPLDRAQSGAPHRPLRTECG